MKNLFFIILVALPMAVQAQYFEVGAMLGASNYMGDLSNNSSTVYLQETKPAAGVFVRYNTYNWLTLKLGFNYAMIAGTDANSATESIRSRNLSFRSNLYEFGLSAEFNIPGYQPYAYTQPFSPYLFGGIALTNFNPQAEFNGEWYELQPLGTEGQGIPNYDNPYSKTVFSIPFGIGFKYAFNDLINIGLEFGARKTFTDYLDDVGGSYADYNALAAGNGELAAALANRTGEYLGTEPVQVPGGTQRGDNTASDWYFIAGLTISYNFMDTGLVGSRRRSRGGAGCPN